MSLPIYDAKAALNPMTGGAEIHIVAAPAMPGGRQMVDSITYTSRWVSDGERLPEPSLILTREGATALITALWEAGFRPAAHSAEQRTEAETSAIERHLEDMRQIAFAKIGIDKPELFMEASPDKPRTINLGTIDPPF